MISQLGDARAAGAEAPGAGAPKSGYSFLKGFLQSSFFNDLHERSAGVIISVKILVPDLKYQVFGVNAITREQTNFAMVPRLRASPTHGGATPVFPD
jgi:hypothetical protein